MLTLTIGSGKGGVGKTTLAASLAVESAIRGERVAILDLDRMQCLARWWELRDDQENPRLVVGVDDIPEAKQLLAEARLECPHYRYGAELTSGCQRGVCRF